MAANVKARLKQDGTLLTVGEFDETAQSTHSVTADGIFSDEFDEFTITEWGQSGGSIALNGTSQKLDISASGDFGFGSGNFTIEGWFYFTGSPTIPYMRLWCFENMDNVEVFGTTIYYWNGGSPLNSGANCVVPNAWYHVALVKSGGVAKVYVNGVAKITDNSPGTSANSRAMTIGGELTNDVESAAGGGTNSLDGYLNGYVTQFRVVKGTAVYTANFSPNSLTPIEAVPNTVLLLTVPDAPNMTVDASGTSKSVTNTGSATFSATTPLTTVFNGAMKQLKTGTLQVANEFDEYTGIV
jgi:hypothetical protein